MNIVEEYNPETNEWIRKADMPTKKSSAVALTVNSKIYVIGGVSNNIPLSIMEEYDPLEDKWTERASIPVPFGLLASGAVVDGKIYVIGEKSILHEYSPDTDTWVKKASPSDNDVNFRTLTAVNGKIYAIGGSKDKPVKNVDMYDPITDTWTAKADMPTEKYEQGLASVNSEIYVFGGFNETSKLLCDVEKYDPVSDKWTGKTSMPEGAHFPGVVSLNGKVYILGGHSLLVRFNDLRITVLVYDPSLDK